MGYQTVDLCVCESEREKDKNYDDLYLYEYVCPLCKMAKMMKLSGKGAHNERNNKYLAFIPHLKKLNATYFIVFAEFWT